MLSGMVRSKTPSPSPHTTAVGPLGVETTDGHVTLPAADGHVATSVFGHASADAKRAAVGPDPLEGELPMMASLSAVDGATTAGDSLEDSFSNSFSNSFSSQPSAGGTSQTRKPRLSLAEKVKLKKQQARCLKTEP